jgi:uncharacterized membrane protein
MRSKHERTLIILGVVLMVMSIISYIILPYIHNPDTILHLMMVYVLVGCTCLGVMINLSRRL